ncbi:MAG: tetratricopeptide repeat protein, partial [Myxococcales bacterium]|nr:tetratricopeptide repeat protein [Myxococcales bacterium]
DQFAFCVALYEGLYGERPFAGRTLGEIHINVGADAVRPPAPGRSVPSWLRRIVLQGLRAAPERRHPSMRALLEQLERTPGRRRRRLLGAAAIVALSGGALAIQQLAAARARPCTGAAGRVGEVWSSEHAATAAAAFAASGLSYAAATWTSARARLDAYADDWAKMYTDACEATHVRDEQSVELLDLRMACLERDRQQLAAVVELLEHADREVIEGAVSAVDALPELARCADVPELTGKPPTPDDPAVDELHAALDRASALYVAGKYPDSVAPARAALAIAERLHHGPLLAEAHLMLGKALSTTSVYDEAERELDEAFNRSLASRELRIATRAASQQIFVMRKHKSRLDDAERWAATAHAAIEGLGGDDELTTIVLTNELQIARQRGEHDKARALRRRVLERRLARFPEDSIRVAEARNNAAVGLYDDGRYEDARRELERALVVYYATYGPDHPKVLQARASLAVFMRSLGDYATAVTIMRENYDAYERTLGPNNDDTIDALSNLAVGYIDNGEFDLAEECMLETYERNAALHGDDSVDAAASLGNLAALAMQRRQFAAGETKARVALAGLTKAFGEKHPHVLIAHKMLGSALRGQGRLDEALAEFERARELAEALPPEHPQRGWTRFELAKTYTERDEPGRALELLDEAERRLNDGAQPLTEEDRATLDLARAQALAARGDAGDEVARLAVAARSYYAREPKRRVNELADIDELLAAAPEGR